MSIENERLKRRLLRKDMRIAGLERKVKQLETMLAWRTLDLEHLTRNIRDEVVRALCSVRFIPDHKIPEKHK